jgi:hypothetical protein
MITIFFLLAAVILVSGYFFLYRQSLPPQREAGIEIDYFIERDLFCKLAAEKGAQLTRYPVSALGPEGQELSLDLAWFGSLTAKRVYLHISGTHGVEGHIGSAVQRSIIERGFELPSDSAVVFLHAVNPWGMVNHRRVNENNIDLNRNMLFSGGQYQGAPEAYGAIYDFLNPKGFPRKVDFFYLQIILNILKHGYNQLKQAIAGGQYEFPKGIYFGGKGLESSALVLKQIFENRFADLQELYVIELHTGLGESAKDVLFWAHSAADPKTVWLQTRLGHELIEDTPEGVGYYTPGDLQKEIVKIIPQVDTYWLLEEFGTYGPIRTLKALRDENRYYHAGGSDLKHWSKSMLLEVFSPASLEWQREVIDRATRLFDNLLKVRH